jgi:preprotein translocase SecE subunit
MARDRQSAKQRQAERRAKRLEQQGRSPDPDASRRSEEHPVIDDPTTVEPSPAVSPELAVGAPPTSEGRSDNVVRDEQQFDEAAAHEDDPPPADLEDAWQEIEDWEVGKDGKDGDGSFAPRGKRGEDKEADRKRPRVVQFLVAVWAELQRVQWPDRQALTTLTGVVLGFVLIAGGYLGLLDAIVSRLVNALL